MDTSKIRKGGLRKLRETRYSKNLSLGHVVDPFSVNEKIVKVNTAQMLSIDQVFYSNPIIFAARNVLQGHATSGGVYMKKGGRDVEPRPEFSEHLDEHWVVFARQCIDSLLKYGLVVVGFDRCMIPTADTPLNVSMKNNPADEGLAKSKRRTDSTMGGVVPVVLETGDYQLQIHGVGVNGYTKIYSVMNEKGEEDRDSFVYAKQHPDKAGNVTSAMAALFETDTFTSLLHELALTSESSRSRPQLCTQMRRKDHSASAMDASNLFFDSEARDAHADALQEENVAAVNALAVQKLVCDAINATQTRTRSADLSGKTDSKRLFDAPEVKPVLFCLPQDHEVAPASVAQAGRGDLESLSRFSAEKICAALGVPAELIFSGRYVSNSSSSLRMLSATVSDMAKSVNTIMTKCYRRIYGPSTDGDTVMQLLVNPVVDREAIIKSYAAGLIPRKVAMATVMHDMGASRAEVEEALASTSNDESERLSGVVSGVAEAVPAVKAEEEARKSERAENETEKPALDSR